MSDRKRDQSTVTKEKQPNTAYTDDVGSQGCEENTAASFGAQAPISCMLRLDPHAAFPDTHARSLNTESISKNVPDRNPLTSDCTFMLTPDGWDSPRFLELSLNFGTFPFLSLVLPSRR